MVVQDLYGSATIIIFGLMTPAKGLPYSGSVVEIQVENEEMELLQLQNIQN